MGKQKRLDDFGFSNGKKNNPKSSKRCCSHCGSDKYVKDGKRRRKYLGLVQIYLCKKCGRKFSDIAIPYTHYPIWVLDIILSLFVGGLSIQAIPEEVKKTAKLKGMNLSISIPTVIKIIINCSNLLLKIEEHYHHTLKSNTWQIDDCFQPRPHRLWYYITNVMSIDQRYWLASHVSKNRDNQASITALQQAKLRAGYYPIVVQCDGLKSHSAAIKRETPNAHIDQEKKSKDISIVNEIERLNREMRRLIPKLKRFDTIEFLQATTEIKRLQYNFLKTHKSLGGKTPAQAAGIKLKIHGWKDLLTLAIRLSRKKR